MGEGASEESTGGQDIITGEGDISASEEELMVAAGVGVTSDFEGLAVADDSMVAGSVVITVLAVVLVESKRASDGEASTGVISLLAVVSGSLISDVVATTVSAVLVEGAGVSPEAAVPVTSALLGRVVAAINDLGWVSVAVGIAATVEVQAGVMTDEAWQLTLTP